MARDRHAAARCVCADMAYPESHDEAMTRGLTASGPCAGLENYTAVEERLVEYVSAAQNVVTLNAQLTQLATQQLETFVAQVRRNRVGLKLG